MENFKLILNFKINSIIKKTISGFIFYGIIKNRKKYKISNFKRKMYEDKKF